jgi:hypothetical protein
MEKLVTVLWTRVVALIVLASSIAGCASMGLNQSHYEGAGVGAALGGATGALLNKKNPWQGGVIGAGLGAVFGASIVEITKKGSAEAARTGRPVEYRTEDGKGVYRAEPVGEQYGDERTTCRKVRERIYEGDKLTKDVVKEVCTGEKTSREY